MDLLRDGEMDGCSNRQTYRHIQTDKDRHTDRKAGRQAVSQSGRQTVRNAVGQTLQINVEIHR